MQQAKLKANESITRPEEYSNKARHWLKQSLIVFLFVFILASIIYRGEFVLIISFPLFLYTFFLGTASLIGLFFQKTKWKYYIQSILVITVSFSLIFFHLYVGFIVITQETPSKRIAQRVICGSNLKQLGICCVMYRTDCEVWPDTDWCDVLGPYYEDSKSLLCPADKIGPCSYAMNEDIPTDVNELPNDLVVLFESAPGWNRIGGVDDVVTDRHGRPGANIAFADGRVEFVEAEEIPNLRWTVEGKSVERK